VTLGDLAKFKW